jgi:hypothetical protein
LRYKKSFELTNLRGLVMDTALTRPLVSLAVLLALMAFPSCRESQTPGSLKAPPDCSNVGTLPEKQFKQCACQEIERFLDEAKRIYQASSQSVRTTRREEMEQFLALARKFEDSPVFLRLPVHLRDYVLSHNDAWETCRRNDELEKCSQASGMRSTVVAMCKQWRDE